MNTLIFLLVDAFGLGHICTLLFLKQHVDISIHRQS